MRRKFSKNTCLHPAPREPQKVYLRTKNSLLRAFLFIGLCLALAGCFDNGDCLFTSTTDLKIRLIKAEKKTEADTVTFSSIISPGSTTTPGGVLWTLPEGETLTAFILGVDPQATQMTYVFQYGTRSDTLVLSYTTQTIVLSPDCGSYNYHTDLTIEHSTFGAENVIIADPKLLSTVPFNLEIYL